MSVVRAFQEGRLQWLCTDVFFMEGSGLPMRDYWVHISPPHGSSETDRYVVLHLHYLGTPDAPRFDVLAQINVRFGRLNQGYQFQPHGQVQQGMDSHHWRTWLVTGHRESSETAKQHDTRWMGPATFTPQGWPEGSRARDLPPWRWRDDPDRTMAGQEAEGDGRPVSYSPDEIRRFRQCHDLLLSAEQALCERFALSLNAGSDSLERDIMPTPGGPSKPFASPIYWAAFKVTGWSEMSG